MDKIYSHACDYIRDRVAPANPENDGKQTPMRGCTTTCSLININSKFEKVPQVGTEPM